MAQPPPVPPVPDSDRYWSAQLDAAPTASAQVPFQIYGDASDLDVVFNGTSLPAGSWSLISASSPALTLDQLPRPITDGLVLFSPPVSAGRLELIGDTRPRQTTMPSAPGIARREFNQTTGNLTSILRELWRKSRQGGAPLKYDAAGPLIIRAAYDLEKPPFLYLQTDDAQARVVYYAKMSAAEGDWSGPLVVTGAAGKDANAVAADRRVAALWSGDGQGTSGGTACLVIMADGSARAWGAGTNNANGGTGASARWLPRTLQVSAGNAVKPTLPFVQAARCGSSLWLLDSAGLVFAMGNNISGQLGLGDTVMRTQLTLVASLRNAGISVASMHVAAGAATFVGGSSMYFLTTTGALYACGLNGSGQLGDGSTTNRSTPVRCGTLVGVTKVSVGVGYSSTATVMALAAGGNLYAWGSDVYGQLGDGGTDDRSSPFLTLTDVVDVAVCCGSSGTTKGGHALAVKTDGTVRVIGNNASGQLGLGDTAARAAWTQIPGITSAAKAYSGGGYSATSAVLLSDGTIRLWGANASGQVGNSAIANQLSPFNPPGLFQGKVTSVHMFGSTGDGVNLTVLLCSDGTMWGCGNNLGGALAQSNGFTSLTVFAPITLPPGVTSAPIALKLGGALGTDSALFVLLADGSMWASGGNADGRLGVQAGNLHAIDGLERVIFT